MLAGRRVTLRALSAKAPYSQPKLIVLGTVADLTKSLATGPNIDLTEFSPSL